MIDTEGIAEQITSGVTRVIRLADASVTLAANLLGHVGHLVDEVVSDSLDIAEAAEGFYTATLDGAAALRDAARATPRFLRIATDLLWIATAYRIHQNRAEFLTPDAVAANFARLHRDSAQRLYALCVELRGGLIKFGQFASSRMDLLPQAYIDSLSLLQDRVPSIPVDAIVERIEEELGSPLDELFASFECEPIATASLAQVHGAVLKDGTRVVVKVQLPGIDELIESDLTALRILSRSLHDVVPQVDLLTVAKELTRSVREELDFEAEARHARCFAEQFAGDPDIVIPKVFEKYSSRCVLTLARLDGQRLVSYLDACETRGETGGAERDRLFTILVRSFCAQILAHGRFHADSHPGNFLVLDGARLGIVDFGSVKVFTPAVRKAYAALASAILYGDGPEMARILETVGFKTRHGATDGLQRSAEMFLEIFRPDAALDAIATNASERFEKLLHAIYEQPIVQIPQDFVLLGRVLATLGGLVMRYHPRSNFYEILVPYMQNALAES